MKKIYIKPTSKVYEISPEKYAIGLPVTSEYDDDSRQARKYNEYNFEPNTDKSSVWDEW